MGASQLSIRSNGSPHSCTACSVRGSCLGRGLNEAELLRLDEFRGPTRVLRNGRQLFHAGADFEGLFIVRSGALKVVMGAENGDEQITGFYLPGELLGIDGIETNQYRTTAIALETSSVCAIPLRRLAAAGNGLGDLQAQLWRRISREVSTGQSRLLNLGRRDAEARVADFLLSLSERLHRIGYSALEFRLPMGRHEIGNYLGVSLETVSRIFTRFEKAGIIGKDRRLVKLIDVARLRVRCGRQAEATAAGTESELPVRAPRHSITSGAALHAAAA